MAEPCKALVKQTISNFSNKIYKINEVEACAIVLNFSSFAKLLLKLDAKRMKGEQKINEK